MSRGCEYPDCKATAAVLYSGHPACMGHLEMHCRGEVNLKVVFGIAEVSGVV